MESKEIDYYAVLNIPRNAYPEEIALAYRKYAILYHPHRDQTEVLKDDIPFPDIPVSTLWTYVNLAYDILSNPLRREIYDKYGTLGLERGIPLPDDYFPPYQYHGDCFKTFFDVFASYSPNANIIDAITNPPPLFNKNKTIGIKQKANPITKCLCLDLKEIFFGTIKRMKILRHEFIDATQSQTNIKEKILIIPIKPGIPAGTKIIFPEEGDRDPTIIPADIIFVINDKPHCQFYRKNSDLYMEKCIDLKEALCGTNIDVKTIDDRILHISLTDIAYHTYIKKIPKEGLPIFDNPKEKGDLYIRFDVNFPKYIPRNLKVKLVEIFDEIQEETNSTTDEKI